MANSNALVEIVSDELVVEVVYDRFFFPAMPTIDENTDYLCFPNM